MVPHVELTRSPIERLEAQERQWTTEAYSTSKTLFRWPARFRDEVFDVGELPWQRFAKPADAVGCDQHIVFDAYADAFVLRKHRSDGSLELHPIGFVPAVRHLIQRLRPHVNSRLVCKHNA